VDLRKYLPLLIIAFVALFILPQLLNRGKSSKTLSSDDRAALTLDAINRIDRAEAKRLAAKGSYTGNLSDLVRQDKQLAVDLTVPLTVEIDIGSDGNSYLVRVSSDVISFARARTNGKITAANCRELKKDVDCPEPAAKTQTGTTATTTSPTTTTD
jgi:hypothetical protein